MKKRLVTLFSILLISLALFCACGSTEDKDSEREKLWGYVQSILDQEEKVPSLDTERYAYYGLLTEEEKLIYEKMVEGIEQGQETIPVTGKIEGDAFYKVMQYIAFDQPQLFWYKGSSAYTYDKTTGRVLEAQPCYNGLEKNLKENQEKVAKAAEKILNKIKDMSDLEAERYCHDYLTRKVQYKEGKYDQNLYSALVQKKTVCSGYTKAMQYLMLEKGIPCYYCLGTVYSSGSESVEPHSWNILKLDGAFYNLDVTWDDYCKEKDQYPSLTFYSYYNVTDKKLNKTHTRDDYGALLPACKGRDYSYKSYYGHSWLHDVKDQVSLSSSKVIGSLEDYYRVCRKVMKKKGCGNYTISLVISGTKTIRKIEKSGLDDWYEHVADPVADALGLHGYHYSMGYTYWELGPGSGSYYVEVNVGLE